MKSLFMPSTDSPVMVWLLFIAFLLLVCLCFGGAIIWFKRSKSNQAKRKRRKHHHHRPSNPTLAQTGGLPPKRAPNEPPPGP